MVRLRVETTGLKKTEKSNLNPQENKKWDTQPHFTKRQREGKTSTEVDREVTSSLWEDKSGKPQHSKEEKCGPPDLNRMKN